MEREFMITGDMLGNALKLKNHTLELMDADRNVDLRQTIPFGLVEDAATFANSVVEHTVFEGGAK